MNQDPIFITEGIEIQTISSLSSFLSYVPSWKSSSSPQDPIFITEGIEIEEETDGSTLTVHNLQLEDQVNHCAFPDKIVFSTPWIYNAQNIRGWSNASLSTMLGRLLQALSSVFSASRGLQVSKVAFLLIGFIFTFAKLPFSIIQHSLLQFLICFLYALSTCQ